MKMSNSTEVIQTIDSKLLFNIDIPEDAINNLISFDNFPCLHYIYHINNLIKDPIFKKSDISKHKDIFYKNKDLIKQMNLLPDFTINEEVLFDAENCLLSRFSCINLIERILKYGKFKNNNILEFNDEWLTKILLLNVFETNIDEEIDMEESHKDLLNLYLSIISYNQFPNDINGSNYFRLSYIYDNYIILNKEINQLFEKNNNYSVKSYLIFLQLFFLFGSYNNPFFKSNFMNNTKLAKEIKKCINEHIFDYNLDSEKNKIIINSYIPSKILLEKPIAIFDNKYLVINPGFLMNRIYGIFFQKIKLSIKNNALFNKKFYGPLFENYCRDIARKYTNQSKYKYYNFIEPFRYDISGDDKESSDFYINYNDITIIFEIKSTQRFIETTIDVDIEGKEKYIEDEMNYKIKAPLEQIEKRLEEIKTLNNNEYPDISLDKIQNSSNYYYIIVSDETIINNYKLYNEYLSKLKVKYSNHIPLYLNISEFEYLMTSLSKRKKAIDKVLEHYYKNYYASTFTEMIMKEKTTFKFSRPDIFDKYPYQEELKSILKN